MRYHSDKAKGLQSNQFIEILKNRGTDITATSPQSAQQNAFAERMLRTIFDATRLALKKGHLHQAPMIQRSHGRYGQNELHPNQTCRRKLPTAQHGMLLYQPPSWLLPPIRTQSFSIETDRKHYSRTMQNPPCTSGREALHNISSCSRMTQQN